MSPCPKKYLDPDPIGAPPEVVAQVILQSPPPKKWKYLEGQVKPRGRGNKKRVPDSDSADT